MLHDGQYGCRKRRSAVYAVAVLMYRTQQAWQGKKGVGALLMDVKAVFNVSRPVLSRRLGELGIVPDLVRWTDSFMTDRRVKLVLEGRERGEHEVETGGPVGVPGCANSHHGIPVRGLRLCGGSMPGHPGSLARG